MTESDEKFSTVSSCVYIVRINSLGLHDASFANVDS